MKKGMLEKKSELDTCENRKLHESDFLIIIIILYLVKKSMFLIRLILYLVKKGCLLRLLLFLLYLVKGMCVSSSESVEKGVD